MKKKNRKLFATLIGIVDRLVPNPADKVALAAFKWPCAEPAANPGQPSPMPPTVAPDYDEDETCSVLCKACGFRTSPERMSAEAMTGCGHDEYPDCLFYKAPSGDDEMPVAADPPVEAP